MKDINIFSDTRIAFRLKSNWQLFKTYILFKFIKNSWINKISTFLTSWLVKINAPITSCIVKNIVFNHFCGGYNKKECFYVIKKLYQYNVKSVLDYSIEGQSNEKDFDHIYSETISNIDFCNQNIEIPFIVFKPTGIGKIDIYEKISKKEKLNNDEKISWQKIKDRFHGICKKASESNVLVLIDAEESWMQNAVDDLCEKMMEKYNKEKAIIFNTLQMYRWDRLNYLKKSHQIAKEKKYYLGYKLVRGAYMEKERLRAKNMGYTDPIQVNKLSTDKDYNEALIYSIDNNENISIFAGTHNEKSCELLISLLKEKKVNNTWFGQLYGMSDHITFKLSDEGYNVAKYLPYGPLKKTIPYLIRRAQENVSVLGQSSREIKLITKEIKRRISLFF